MELYFVIKLVCLINNGKGFKACLRSMFQLWWYLSIVCRPCCQDHAQKWPLCRANHERRRHREYLVLTVVCSSQSTFFWSLLAFSFRFGCILTESSWKMVCFSPSFYTLRQPGESICFLGYFIHHFFVFLLFFFRLTSSTAALPLSLQLFSAIKTKIKDIL